MLRLFKKVIFFVCLGIAVQFCMSTTTQASDSYFESVAGIHLGMARSEVTEILGAPSSTQGSQNHETLVYGDGGLKIRLDNGSSAVITFSKSSGYCLEKSGLSCNDSLEAFYNTYHLNRMPHVEPGFTTGCYSIGHGEYLMFDNYPNSIDLTIYSN